MRISDWSSDVCSSDLFLAAAFVVQKTAEQAAGHHADARRAHAAPGHAAVLRVDHHRDAVRLQMVPDALRYLGGQPFLHLEPARIAVEDACESPNADQDALRQIGG